MTTKYVFITGGVVSSLGKGIIGASIGSLIRFRGKSVTIAKVDPYLNVDAGTMNPYQHGEVFVTSDGAETDLDIGHYERFGIACSAKNSITAGQIYRSVLENERRGDYLGQTVQVIPHVTNEINRRIEEASTGFDVAIIEIGGTVGDLEGLPFLEAARQFAATGKHVCVFVHVTLLPMVSGAGEVKTKPTQHSVQKLREIGILPNVIVCRSDFGLSDEHRKKISMFCGVPPGAVFLSPTVKDIYSIPEILASQGLDNCLLGEGPKPPKTERGDARCQVRVGLVGKYTDVKDAYKSIHEALAHAGNTLGLDPQVIAIDSETVQRETMGDCDAIVIPGGFGGRGVDGKLIAAKYARENGVPFLGICLGLQVAAIELLRAAGHDANSEEFKFEDQNPAIAMLDGQKGRQKGASMRLGDYRMIISDETARALYGCNDVLERHRHRYEVNPVWRDRLEKAGAIVCGVDEQSGLIELLRLESGYYFACQFHPEFRSRPDSPHPLFVGLLEAAIRHCDGDKVRTGKIAASGTAVLK